MAVHQRLRCRFRGLEKSATIEIMSTITIQEIQRDPLAFLRRVEAGEALVVVRDDRPVAEIRPVSSSTGQSRPFGLCAGEFRVMPNFDDPLPEDLIREFEGV